MNVSLTIKFKSESDTILVWMISFKFQFFSVAKIWSEIKFRYAYSGTGFETMTSAIFKKYSY